MNTQAIQTKVADLKKADISAFNAGVKSNHLTNFVRNELIKKAYAVDKTLNTPVTVEFNMTIMSYVAPSLALLSKEGQYPALFIEGYCKFSNGNITFTYVINSDGLSNEYRERLNETLGINLDTTASIV